MKRTLTLKRETLAELTATELAGVAGAAAVPTLKCGPTLSFTCYSEIDACLTAHNCTL